MSYLPRLDLAPMARVDDGSMAPPIRHVKRLPVDFLPIEDKVAELLGIFFSARPL